MGLEKVKCNIKYKNIHGYIISLCNNTFSCPPGLRYHVYISRALAWVHLNVLVWSVLLIVIVFFCDVLCFCLFVYLYLRSVSGVPNIVANVYGLHCRVLKRLFWIPRCVVNPYSDSVLIPWHLYCAPSSCPCWLESCIYPC